MKMSLQVFPVFILLLLMACQQKQDTNEELETLRLTHESMREIIDLKLNEAIWTDKQRGRDNEEILLIIQELSASRKALDIESPSAIQDHVSTLRSLILKTENPSSFESSLNRADQYMAEITENKLAIELLQSEFMNVEFRLLQYWSAQMGIVDCCFPSLMAVQSNVEVKAGERYEMAIFPRGERAQSEYASYKYHDIYVTSGGSPVSVPLETKRIGHVLSLEFDAPQQGAYMLHFSVEETGEYIAEPWQQDFEWSFIVQ